MEFEFMSADTVLPPCMPLPAAMLRLPISSTAKVMYLDEIEHDPYVLISILSALHDGVFTLAEVQGELEMLFEKQYILTETVTIHKPRASVRKQLSETKQAASPKRAAARSKQHEMEV